ncbi:MAG: keto-deoxy-phosphogluconate aldolase [Devosia sp. 67-54]|uniref:bifunctional 4-hydroxy-2-oxoglutarate aldolase/2-dehydro-3-deoxy-phosphogluconate aldolase n=1 Tax=unclassified Devosia TaxID=196773 RepID=UPI00086D81DC|nr:MULTISPECIES: bifunctional 4-hydroxy-2-oxoglutarate aldolase/2-dehydro-3-deoxy-phosphogluconate aldolase [unclassified Devosia]MBN9305776.1 bifunctional 4-hydroxy-2-oxoglutarate aldolase/2-dehydro-3-deoxy-phosphogluconate aldolase [Devosia sp.]ODU62249.1 MAG: keto-deoxy-phosphogluconate aldolase [Pelagibacterium sp. SCN 68-10]OJX16515.1 MAG: keto-deoxy-phosphogluconate aldolase [Devosia sp. 67-54]
MPQDAEVLRSTLSLAPVIPVIILDDVQKARPLAEALVAGGLPVLEVTLRTPRALQVIEEMAKVPGAVVGSGTVRSPLQMGHSVDAGAKFMVSPGASPRLLEAADEVSIPLLPGIGTPTEAMTAHEHGYYFLKFFPAEALGGAAVLKAFASPLSDITFCPTGGIDAVKARTYLALPNVICVGGSWVMPQDALEAGDWARIEGLAREAAALKRG